MVQISYSSTLRTVSILYSISLVNRLNIDLTQFAVVNSTVPITIVAGNVTDNIITLELSGTPPISNFGIIYTPGSASASLKATDNSTLGRIYYSIEVINPTSICPNGDCSNNDPKPPVPLMVESVFCLDDNTIEVFFNRYLSSNFIPDVSSFSVLDQNIGIITQVSVLGKRVLLEHTYEVPLSDKILQYLPPATNYLRTSSNPPILVLPFTVNIACVESIDGESCLINSEVHKNGVGTPYGTRIGTLATIEDYVLIYGISEAIQASNDDNGSATVINRPRLQAELDHAGIMLQNYIDIATWSGKSLLAGSFKRTQLVIARYYLLNKSRPEVVREEFERTLQWIEQSTYNNSNKQNPDCDNGVFNGTATNGAYAASTGRVLNYIGAAQYRVTDGLGLRGFFLNPDEDNLSRIQGGYSVPDHLKRRRLNY